MKKSSLNEVLIRTNGVLALGLLGWAGTASLQAQTTNAPEEMKPVVVTGSYIPTADTVGPSAVDTVTAATVQNLGKADILRTLKAVDASFSGNGSYGQEVNNGAAGESYVQIRNLPTLVLLNGRRLGNTAFSNGGLVDLNTIPTAAIERIEVLKDGASAIYGSDAIGGVVNIITKKDFTETEIGGRFGGATGQGKWQQSQASVVTGMTTDKASFMAAGQFYSQDALLSSDRSVASMTPAELESNGLYGYGSSYLSPSFAGKVQDNNGSYLLRGSPLLKGTSGYNAAFNTPPVIAGKSFSGATAVSDYNAAYVAANPGSQTPYVRIGGTTLLNTTTLGTDSMQSQQRKSFIGSFTYDLLEKRVQLFTDFLYANSDSEGMLAPSPVTGLASKQSNIDIPANNIYNPFGVDLGPSAGTNGVPPQVARIRSRFVDSGSRIFDYQSDYYHFVAGLKGDLGNGYTYNAAYNFNNYDQMAYTRNAINGAALDLALKPNSDSAKAALGLSQLLDANGQPVPMYNMFSIGGNNASTLDAIRTTLFNSGNSQEWDAGANITGTPFDLPGGKLGVALGGSAMSQSLSTDIDGLTRMGKVPGLNAAMPTSGTQNSWNVFVEVNAPITSPDMNIPVLHSLEVTAAGRYDHFDPGGNQPVPKVGVRWQPLDEQFTLRGSFSESFIAPTTYQLFGGNQVNVPAMSLPDAASAQEYTVNTSSANLEAQTAKNWGVGIVISPKAVKGLTVSCDYYHVALNNGIYRLDPQTMVDDLNANGSASAWKNYYSKPDGSRLTTTAPNQVTDAQWGSLDVPLLNGAKVVTDGVDVTGSYKWDLSAAGVINLYANANVLFSYTYEDPVAGGPYDYKGQYSDANVGAPGGQGMMPNFVLNTGFTWEYYVRSADLLSFTVNNRYIPQVDSPLTDTTSGDPWVIQSYFQLDMQIAYELGKKAETKKWYDGTRLAIGCNNVANQLPRLIGDGAFEDNTDKSTYDIIGRFIYFEISKKF